MANDVYDQLAELKRCFAFICSKFHWVFQIEETCQAIDDCIFFNSEEAFGHQLRLVDALVQPQRYLKFHANVIQHDNTYCTVDQLLRAGVPKTRICQFLKANLTSAYDFCSSQKFQFIFDVDFNDSIYSIEDYYKKQRSASMLKLFQKVKHCLCDANNTIITKLDIDLHSHRIVANVLSKAFPEFQTLEELRIRLDLDPVVEERVEVE